MRNEFSKTATKDFVESKIADAKFQLILLILIELNIFILSKIYNMPEVPTD